MPLTTNNLSSFDCKGHSDMIHLSMSDLRPVPCPGVLVYAKFTITWEVEADLFWASDSFSYLLLDEKVHGC